LGGDVDNQRDLAIQMAVSSDGSEASIDVYDVVGETMFGEGTTAKSVRADLSGFTGKSVAVRVNSIGGDVFDGVAIYNLLRDVSKRGAEVTVDVDGLAASSASIIMCAGDKIRIARNAMVMIHNAWSMSIGDANALRKKADTLEKVSHQIAATYAETMRRNGKEATSESVAEQMSDETWLTAEEALEMGLCTEITKASEAAAMARTMDIISGAPEPLQASWREKANVQDTMVVTGTTPTTPAKSGTTEEDPTIMSMKLIKALGAETEEDALKIAGAAGAAVSAAEAAVSASAELTALTGKPLSESLAVVQAWRASAERLPALESERDAAVKALADRDAAEAQSKLAGLVSALLDDGKLTVDMRAWAETQTLAQLQAYAEVAQCVVPPNAAEPATPENDAVLSSADRDVAAKMGISIKEFARAKRDMATATGVADELAEEDDQ
jgi:ATP-dependent protease ClpP protease subunit